MSFELCPDCIASGIIDTKFKIPLTSNEYIDAEKALENAYKKGFGLPEDIGVIVSFLCSGKV